jgi:hypothetical protein
MVRKLKDNFCTPQYLQERGALVVQQLTQSTFIIIVLRLLGMYLNKLLFKFNFNDILFETTLWQDKHYESHLREIGLSNIFHGFN